MSDGDRQTGSLTELISQYPDLCIAIGHFGMVTRDGWTEQIKLAKNKNVRIESGGITTLEEKSLGCPRDKRGGGYLRI